MRRPALYIGATNSAVLEVGMCGGATHAAAAGTAILCPKKYCVFRTASYSIGARAEKIGPPRQPKIVPIGSHPGRAVGADF